MAVTVAWFDYTCGYSYRLWRWLGTERVAWRTFSLRQVNHPPATLDSVSVLALALSHAAREADFAAYHAAVFESFHEDGLRMTPDLLRAVARRCGVGEVDEDALLRAVLAEHESAAEAGVFGTPTLVFEDGSSVFLKLAEVPENGDELWDAVRTLVMCHPEMVEIKRPG